MEKLQLPEFEISIRYKNSVKKSELIKVTCSKDIADICKMVHNADTVDWYESMILVCLNRANKVIGWAKISQGGITGTVCDPRIVLTHCLNCVGTTNLIITHNHPSGNLKPSRSDEELTNKIKQAALLLDIKLLDHIIVSDEGYFSFADEGLL